MTESVKRNNSTSKLKGVLRKSLNFEDCELREVEETFDISRDSVKKYKKKYSYFIYKPVTLIEFYKKDTVCEELMEISEPYITFIDLDFFLDEKKVINFFKEIKTNKIQKKFLVYGSKKNLIKLVGIKQSCYRVNKIFYHYLKSLVVNYSLLDCFVAPYE